MTKLQSEGATPFFSVVIPTYRRPELLRQALRSVVDQTFDDFEIVVVDDDPGCSARPVVHSFDDSRVHYLPNDRTRGGAGTRNAGIFRARGRWIAFLDDDDTWLPEKLERQHERLVVADDELGLHYTGYVHFDFERQEAMKVRLPSKKGWIAQDLLERNWIGGMFCVAIRADLLREIGGHDERFPAMQDAELFVRLARRARVDFIDQALVLVRKDNDDRITRSATRKLRGSILFNQKFKAEIDRVPRLRHQAASRVFTFALMTGDVPSLLRSLPWVLAGIVVAPGNLRAIGSRLRQQFRYQLDARRGTAEAARGRE